VPSTLEEKIAAADVVVVGVLQDVVYEGPIEEVASRVDYQQAAGELLSAHVLVKVERYLKGTGAEVLRFDHPFPVFTFKDRQGNLKMWIGSNGDCTIWPTEFGEPIGYRWLLAAKATSPGSYFTAACSGNVLLHPTDRKKWLGEYDTPLGLAPGTVQEIAFGPPPWGAPIAPTNVSDRDHFPYVPAAALAVLGPLAFLAGAAFLWRRGEPHNG
jgi:hypothetical protein